MVAREELLLIEKVFPKGELSLVCVPIAAEAMFDIFSNLGKSRRKRNRKIICGSLTLIVLLICCFWYPAASIDSNLNPSRVTNLSIWLFVWTVITSGVGKYLIYEEQRK